jgi:hypothetical protein
VPANERAELRKCASNVFQADEDFIVQMERPVADAAQKILGKDISEYTNIQIDNRGRVFLLSGNTEDGIKYSEFHFGAGESSIIRMVMIIETMPENSLVLIEEIENGLHPIATIRIVEYLIEVAERKKAQVIFTTHSNDALLPLPSQAIWSAIGKRTFQGKLDIHALRAITGQIEAQLVIFTEDQFAAAWIRAMLRAYGDIAIDLVEVHPMQGDGAAVAVNKYHNMDPSSRYPSVCFIDGDSLQTETVENKVFRLPGQSPEAHIYDAVLERLDEFSGILAVSLHQPYEKEEHIQKILRDIRHTNRDPHLLFSQVGKKLGLIPESTVREAFASVWTQAYSDEVKEILAPIVEVLPFEQHNKH